MFCTVFLIRKQTNKKSPGFARTCIDAKTWRGVIKGKPGVGTANVRRQERTRMFQMKGFDIPMKKAVPAPEHGKKQQLLLWGKRQNVSFGESEFYNIRTIITFWLVFSKNKNVLICFLFP